MSRVLELERCRVDLDRGLILRADDTMALTTREAELLSYLAARPNQTVSRHVLHDALWGAGPAVVTRALDNTIQRLRLKIGDRVPLPRHLLTVYGEGYRFVPLERPPERPRSLPVELDRYIGRQAEQERLEAWLAEPGIVVLSGPAGVGKTRLALRAASARRGRVVWVELVAARDPEAAWQAMASALQVRGADSRASSWTDAVLAALAELEGGLLVLDNVEQLRAIAAITATIHAAAPALCTLLTTRLVEPSGEPLAGPRVGRAAASPAPTTTRVGERSEPARTTTRVLELGPLPLREAVELLEVRADPRATAPDPAVAAAIARRLDGLPLAIELAARRLGVVAAPELLALLDDRFALTRRASGATVRARAGDPGMGVLWQTLEWSWELLDEDQRGLLAALAVIPASFGVIEAAAAAGLDAASVADGLASLADHNLLVAREGRFTLYEGVRAHARRRRPVPAALLRLVRALAASLAADRDAAEGPEGPAARARLAAAQPLVRATLDLVLATRVVVRAASPRSSTRVVFGAGLATARPTRARGYAASEAVILALATAPGLSGVGTLEGHQDVLRRTIAAVSPRAPRRAELWLALAEAAMVLGDPEAAERWWRRACGGARARHPARSGDQARPRRWCRPGRPGAPRRGPLPGLARWIARISLANLQRVTGRHAEAQAALQQLLAEPAPRDPRAPRWRGIALGHLGTTLALRGDLAGGIAASEEALRLLGSSPRNRALVWSNLGVMQLRNARLAEALACFGEAIPVHRAWHDARGLALALTNRGAVRVELGQTEAAEADLQEALVLARPGGDRRLIGTILADLGIAALDRGRWQVAEETLRDATRTLGETGDPVAAAQAQGMLAIARWFQGFRADAVADAREAAARARQGGQTDLLALWTGWQAFAAGDPLPADAPLDPKLGAATRAALRILREGGDAPESAVSADVRLARTAWAARPGRGPAH